MIPTAFILMYSGMQNPEKELSREETNILKDLVSKLEIKYTGQTHPHMGFSGYGASLSDDLYVIASLRGFIQLFDKTGLPVAYSDTTGILAYLHKIMAPVMARHEEEAAEARNNFDWEQLLIPYNPNPWEPQF